MTERRIVEMIHNAELTSFLFKSARRWTKNQDDQEEYVQDARLRIARDCEDCDGLELLKNVGRKCIEAAYRKRYRDDDKKGMRNVIGLYKGKCIALGRGRYLSIKAERLSPWYYIGEWGEICLGRDDVPTFPFNEIFISK